MSSAGFPSKSGGVTLEDYTTNGMILEFGPIATSLQTEFDNTGSNPVLEACNISELVASIINFQEKHCGFNSPHPRPFTRFPFGIFRDYKLHGHLHRLLRFMISYCAKQDWYRSKYSLNEENTSRLLINLNDASLVNEYFLMFKHVENQLKKQQIITPKLIYFSPSIGIASQQTLAQIARNHGAQISDQHTPRVTHIILPNNLDMEDSGEEHVRTVDKQENLAYIHYWFYPSSYDQWIRSDLIDGDAEHIEPPNGAWRVGERFLTDLDTFNEWMIELDYEVLDGSPEPNNNNNPSAMQPTHEYATKMDHMVTTNNGDYNNNYNNNNNTNNPRKRKRKRDRNESGMVLDDMDHEDLDGDWVPPSKKPKTVSSNANHFNNKHVIDLDSDIDGEDVAADAADLANNNANGSSTIRHKVNVKPTKKKKLTFSLKRRKNPGTHRTSSEAVKREIAAKKKGMDPVLNGGDIFPFAGSSLSRIRPMISSYPIVIPSYARWFRLDRIHPIEYQSLNSLFQHKAMQYHERYMDIRNFMVNSYRINPRIYLTVTASRRIIAADAGCVYRIHKFLEHWGLINYQIDDGSIPEFAPPIMDYTHIDTPFGVKIALQPKASRNATNPNGNGYHQTKAKEEQKALSLRENMFCVKPQHPNRGSVTVTCTFCDIECNQARYRCSVEKEMILCSKCFDAKRYSMVFNENDFEMELTQTQADINTNNNDNNNNNNDNTSIALWSEDELKKLKYGIKTWHDNWNRVSEYVGRNEEECIAQFIQLPIKDAFIDTVEAKHTTIPPQPNASQPMLSFLNTNTRAATVSPFGDAQHPVLAQCASLSAIVDSELVNIASCAALQFVSKQKVIEANALKVNDCVDTKMGRGVIEHIANKDEYQIKFEWGVANLKFDDIIDVVCEDEDATSAKRNGDSWLQYPQNVNQSKAKAAGILATTTLIAKALKNHKDGNIEQLLQHLVLLQSQKVKAKLAHLDELWSVLQEEKEEVEDMKQELFRERIELAKQRLDLQQEHEEEDEDDIDVNRTGTGTGTKQ